ncbi:MAG: tRNA uridine-5-carboxymethylaminomethyl(34) synthesis GTPase MnmE [Gammaproteobacteria bacterium]|jgi:tRNA modification GTPase|nr:tRNA uridine-5-carboxymethylaminomethyl(34) synthesis GTPase MnmE [Gammaproteobacteria bacterium]
MGYHSPHRKGGLAATRPDVSQRAQTDTICAIATPAGSGGIGVVRVSGPDCVAICTAVAGAPAAPRTASLRLFRDASAAIIDQGLMLYFPAPDSFTGEDVIELHAHGGAIILQMLLQALLDRGARAARAGEFSERAFLNDKLDLTQAEAIADLISAGSTAAAKAAQRSLQGGLSAPVQDLQRQLISLRVWIEAALDFPDDEIDFLADDKLQQQLQQMLRQSEQLLQQARQGQRVLQGARLAILGPPNAGKSSLLNALLQRDAAIVTELPGTTRDVLRERLEINGIGLEIIDTAGLRDSVDPVEIEGMRRAHQVLAGADLLLWVQDLRELASAHQTPPVSDCKLVLVANKQDLASAAQIQYAREQDQIPISAKTAFGLAELEQAILSALDLDNTANDRGSQIMAARPRHIAALQQVNHALLQAQQRLLEGLGELAAEELLAAQQALSELTGDYHNDDLLGAIFSSFCIGK